MKLPRTLEEINGQLGRRAAAGECVEVFDVKLQVLSDARVGLFLRMIIVLADGSTFTVDTDEPGDLLRSVEAH